MTLSNLRKTLQQLQPVLHNKKLNVGAVKEQVGVAFTYPNIHLSAWFLESSGHCCSDNRGSTVICSGDWILYVSAMERAIASSLLLFWENTMDTIVLAGLQSTEGEVNPTPPIIIDGW